MTSLMASCDEMECVVCNEGFDEEEHRPLLLSCSHSFCKRCIDGCIDNDNCLCPLCRDTFHALSSEEFPLNRGLLDMVRYVKQMESKLPKCGISYETWLESQKESETDGKKTQREVEKLIQIDEDLIAEVRRINAAVKDDVTVKLAAIVEDNEKFIKDLEERKTELENLLEDSKEKKKKVNEAQVKLEDASDFTTAGPLMDEISLVVKAFAGTISEMKGAVDVNQVLLEKSEKNHKESQRRMNSIQEILNAARVEEEDEDEEEDNISNIGAVVEGAESPTSSTVLGKPMQCGNCNEGFIKEEHRPVLLPCSHSFCVRCVDGFISNMNRNLRCPTCQQVSYGSSSAAYPINRGLLDMVRYVNNQMEANLLRCGISYKRWQESKKEKGTKAKKIKDKVELLMKVDENLIDEAQKINGAVKDDINLKLEEMVKDNGKFIDDLKEHKDKLDNLMTDVKENEKQVNEAQMKLEGAVNFTTAGPLMDEISTSVSTLLGTLSEMEAAASANQELLDRSEKNNKEVQTKIDRIRKILNSTTPEEGVTA
ncbi:putative leucine-rich repeat-containing protein DDB_G0290503 [Palaemon carinicauda]|uniref:putative leucine-rich repeat-containing protein DDB_G0290503 n=1 Tax=Palaemon carinicauda TaxID=392227 RepID=UPI0035B5C126